MSSNIHVNIFSRKQLIAIVLILVLLASVFYAGYVYAQSGSTFSISSGFYPQADFTIWREGSTYFAKDGFGAIPSWGESTNASLLIQNVFYSSATGDLSVFFKSGIYELDVPIGIQPSAVTVGNNYEVFGESGAILRANDNFPYRTPNLYPILYTGAPTSNVSIHGLTFDTNAQGNNATNTAMVAIMIWAGRGIKIFENSLIDTSNRGFAVSFLYFAWGEPRTFLFNRDIQITNNFMYLPNSFGVSTPAFGSSFASLEDCSDVIISNNIKVGIDTFVQAQNARNIVISDNTINGMSGILDASGNLTNVLVEGNIQHLIVPTITPLTEPFGAVYSVRLWQAVDGITLEDIVIQNNIIEADDTFSSGALNEDYGIYLQINQPNGYADNIKIQNNVIANTTSYGIWINASSAQTFNGIQVTGNTLTGDFLNASIFLVQSNYEVVIQRNVGFWTENYGNSTGTGAEQTIPHGLSGIPDLVLLSPPTTNAIQSSPTDGTNIYITADNTEPYYWYVEHNPS